MPKFQSFCTKGCPKLWIARITGEDSSYGYKREWVTVEVESKEKSLTFYADNLADGLYQFGNQITEKHSTNQEKGYFVVENATIKKLSLAEVPDTFKSIFGHDSAFTPREFKNAEAKEKNMVAPASESEDRYADSEFEMDDDSLFGRF